MDAELVKITLTQSTQLRLVHTCDFLNKLLENEDCYKSFMQNIQPPEMDMMRFEIDLLKENDYFY